jgi:hypothetical protein
MAARTSVAVPSDRATDETRVARFFHAQGTPETAPTTALLENTANNSAPTSSEDVEKARSDRWVARGFLWHESKNDRVRGCGRYSIRPDGSVQVRSNGAAAGFAGLASCGSIWACPVCNSKINAVRRLELGVMIATAESEGLGMAFGAKTIRHHAAQKLADLWPQQSSVWNAVTVDKTVRKLRTEFGFIGYSRAAEVTIGKNGWHPHIHPLYFFAKPLKNQQLEDLHGAEISAWVNKAERVGLQAPLGDAQHLHAVTGESADKRLGEYFTKAGHQSGDSVAWELTSTQTKTGRRYAKTISPWVILAGARTGDADALDLWHEYERASKGKRALTYSRGLRRRFGLDVEASDEDIADAEIGTKEDAIFEITDWEPVRRNPLLGAGILAAVRSNGISGAQRFCAENRIETRQVL